MDDKLNKKGIKKAPHYEIGQKVVATLPKTTNGYLRRCKLELYVGQVGKVNNYYHLYTNKGEVFYIYTVKIGPNDELVAFHSNELRTTYSGDTERQKILSRIRTLFHRPS